MMDEVKKTVDALCKMITDTKSVDEQIELLNYVRKQLHSISPLKNHPSDFVEWVKSEDVEANKYNPNHVAPPEEKLLIQSIIQDGYTMPIVTGRQSAIIPRVIVDGYHRRLMVLKNKKIRRSTFGYVPITTIRLEKNNPADMMAATIRHNRARGEHAIPEMIDLVAKLIGSGVTDAWIIKALGMSPDELLRLKQLSGIVELFQGKGFSASWEPSNDPEDEDE